MLISAVAGRFAAAGRSGVAAARLRTLAKEAGSGMAAAGAAEVVEPQRAMVERRLHGCTGTPPGNSEEEHEETRP